MSHTYRASGALAASCWLVVPNQPFGGAQLTATAACAGGSLAAALLVAAFTVKKQAGAFVPLLTIVRVGLALGASVALGFMMPRFGKLLTPLVAVGVIVAYLVVLIVTREITGADLAPIKAMISRRGKNR